jgi:predicted enzyme related to lactoylglutathione lyase
VEVQGFIVNINSEQPGNLMAFYRDVIGVKPHPDENRESTLVCAGAEIVFDGHSDLSDGAKEPPRTMLNYAVDDVQKEKARLEAAGVRFLGDPSNDVISFATFVDPDGNYGQIFSMQGAPPGNDFFAVQRTSDNPERLKTFYRDVVGLSDDHPELGSPFMAGAAPIYVGEHSEVQGPAKEPARVLFNLFVADLAAEQKRIEGHGVKFLRSAGREYWGGVISTFADPDGNYLQLIEFKP